MTKTFTIRGQKVRSASNRRFLVVVGRETTVVDRFGDTCPAFARVARRSDSVATAQTIARRLRDNGYRGGALFVEVVDSTTGEVI